LAIQPAQRVLLGLYSGLHLPGTVRPVKDSKVTSAVDVTFEHTKTELCS